jgi:uncharacterized cupin superfamily protein
MAMTPLVQGKPLSDLTPWGSFRDIGAEILEGGDVQAFGEPTFGTPADPINAGYFGTTKGKYRLVYPFNEQATLLQGEVCITDESTGESREYRPGDSWFITKGTSTLWEVRSEGFTKHYLSFA